MIYKNLNNISYSSSACVQSINSINHYRFVFIWLKLIEIQFNFGRFSSLLPRILGYETMQSKLKTWLSSTDFSAAAFAVVKMCRSPSASCRDPLLPPYLQVDIENSCSRIHWSWPNGIIMICAMILWNDNLSLIRHLLSKILLTLTR